MKHDTRLTAAAAALLAAGAHLRTRDDGGPLDVLSRKIADMTDASIKRIEAVEEKAKHIDGDLFDIHQRLAARGHSGGSFTPPTWGKQFTQEQETEIRSLAGQNKGSVSLQLKALSSNPDSAGALGQPARDGINALPKQRLTIRDLLNVVSISTGSVEYVQQDARPTGAGVVAEGALKPESEMGFSLKSTSSKVIAHWIKASRQVLEDLPQLSDLIDNEMRYGLALAEEMQVLGGDGTGQNLSGLVTNATAFLDPLGLLLPTMLDILGAAILQSALADYPATGIVMHPADWARMRLMKNADGEYILGDPAAAVEPRLFGLPVVATKAMDVDTFLVGDFGAAATLYDRWQPRVEAGYVNDDFTRNMVTILAEERLALAVKNPTALTYGTFAAAIAAAEA